MATDKNSVEDTNIDMPQTARVIQPKATSRTKPSARKKAKKSKVAAEPKRGPGRKERPYPLSPSKAGKVLAVFLDELGSGQKVRRLVAFDKLGKSPEGAASRKLITNSAKYGLILGNKQSEHLELTPEGLACVRGDGGLHALEGALQQAVDVLVHLSFSFCGAERQQAAEPNSDWGPLEGLLQEGAR